MKNAEQSQWKAVMLIIAVAGALLAVYAFGVRQLDLLGRRLFFEYIVKNTAVDDDPLRESGECLLGLYRPELPYEFSRAMAVEESLEVDLKIISFYQAWGDGDEHSFNIEVYTNLYKGGYIPMITWEPWLVAFDQFAGKQPDSSLDIIASGAVDKYIREWARNATRFGKPFFIRPGHEMSNAWYTWSLAHGNTPEMFKAFWRHVHTIFREEGARNAAFVWNPFVPGDTVYYPGDEYVDWIGLDIFNFGSLAENGRWTDFYTVTKILYDAVKRYEKPVILAEVGCVQAGGNKPNWYRDMFHSLAVGNFPLVKAVVLFDTPKGKTPTGLIADLGVSSNSNVFGAINTEDLIKCGMQPIPSQGGAK